MAGKGTIGGKIVLEGEKAYREALKNIRSDQQELRSEMKLCQSEFKDSQNSLEALTKKYEILTKQVETQAKKVEVYQKAMETSAQKQEQAAEKVHALQTALDKAEKEMEQMSSSTGDNSQAMEEQTKVIDDLKNKLSLAEEGYNKAEQKTKSYQAALNNATAELNIMQDDLDQTARYMKEAEDSTDKCAVSIDEYGKETQDATNKTSVFGDVLKANLVSEVIIAGVKKLANGIKDIADASIEVGSEFEASMSQVAATMGMTAEKINEGSADYEKLTAAAKECGQTTKYSASEAGEALNYLALAGYDVNKSVEALPKVLNLAAAGNLDLAYASDLVTDSMAALGPVVGSLDNYIDEMTKTSQKSNTSIAQLGEATLVCAGTVSLTKQSLETMNAELGILANNGLKGAEGGTHLRNVILALSAPTDKAKIALNGLGVQVSDSSGNMRDLNDILVDLNAAMAGMSSTEKTQMINRIFNKTDIAAVNALLKGTGDEFDNLVTELNNCSGAAEAMADTMNNNFKGKVTILKSSLEALGISAYEIFDDNMKKSVEGATNAVGRLQKAIDSGDLGVSLNKMSDALGEFFEKAIDVGEDALPVVIDALTWILDNSDLIIAGVTGIAAANLEMKVVAPAIEAAQTAWNAYKKANEGATVSQWLLNTAMEANPAGILLTAIVGLTAAVAAYTIINKDNLVQTSEQVQKTKELIEETQALNGEYEKAKEERTQTSEGYNAQATAASKLVAELGELRSKTSLTTDEQTRMKMIVAELNELVPDLNLVYDEQNNIFNKTQSEIEGCVDAYIALYKAQAAQEELQKIAQQQVEYEKQLYDIEKQRTDLQEELTQKQNEYNSVMENCKETYGEMTELYSSAGMAEYQAMMDAKSALDELDAVTQEAVANSEALTEEYEYWIGVVSENQPIYDAAAAEGTLGEEAQEAAASMSDMATSASQAFQEMYESVAESVENQISLFSKFNGEAELTTQDLLSNMQSQVDGITQWADNMELLAERGIDQGLLQHLADLGPEGAGYVATFVSMSNDELQKANELWSDSLTLSDDTAAKVAEAYETAGKKSAEGYSTGISDSAKSVASISGDMAQGSIEEAQKVLGESGGGSSKEFETVGEGVDTGMAAGIKDNQQDVLDTVETLGTSMLATGQENVKAEDWKAVGKKIPDSVKAGIKDNQQDVLNTITALCISMLTTGQDHVRIEDWKAVGKRIPDSVKAGIESGTSSVVSAVKDMVTKAQEAAKEGGSVKTLSSPIGIPVTITGEENISGLQSLANIEAVISAALPQENMILREAATSTMMPTVVKQYDIQQEINIYAMEDDPIDAAKKYRDAQREMVEEW